MVYKPKNAAALAAELAAPSLMLRHFRKTEALRRIRLQPFFDKDLSPPKGKTITIRRPRRYTVR